MSDHDTYTTPPAEEPREETTEERVGAADVPAPAVVAQEPKQVGDEVSDEPLSRDDAVSVKQEQVAAQVAQPRESDADKVNVHEVSVVTDEVITDTSDPRAVQVPLEGQSPLLADGLPIARLDAERVEDVFSREASEQDDNS